MTSNEVKVALQPPKCRAPGASLKEKAVRASEAEKSLCEKTNEKQNMSWTDMCAEEDSTSTHGGRDAKQAAFRAASPVSKPGASNREKSLAIKLDENAKLELSWTELFDELEANGYVLN